MEKRKQYSIKNISALIGLICFISILFSPIYSFAGSITKIDVDDIEQTSNDLKWNEIIVHGSDDNYYKGKASDFFKWVKDRNEDKDFDGPNKKKHDKWKDVDGSKTDGFDAITFSAKVSLDGKATLLVMQNTVAKVLTLTQEEYDYVCTFLSLVQPIGFTLCVLYALLSVADKNEKELLSPLAWILTGMKLGVGIAFVDQADELVLIGYAFANSIIDLFLGTGSNGPNLALLAYEEKSLVSIAMDCDYDGYFGSIGGIIGEAVNMVISNILGSVITILIAASCYARKLEIGVRSVFLPIAVADISGRGLQGPGMRYFKKFLACGLQAGGIIFLISFSASMSSSADIPFAGFALPIAVLGATGMAKRMAEEAFGG